MSQSFAFYIDESGSPKPNPRDSASHFAVGGVLVRQDDESLIRLKITDFKKRWKIDEPVALHGNEIRSRKKNFAWLGLKSKDEQNQFLQDLTDTIVDCPIIVHGPASRASLSITPFCKLLTCACILSQSLKNSLKTVHFRHFSNIRS
ncbi:hypothetical protein NEA10_19165 [Phormidium yuhuli AB48]|uniref:DUF3800 domain-containing protein n=1 Tax=Phormidium yuhuli AB48 TaxID=2940671 RepID=A0ABY5APQ8_9CYAN|nr:DUF3800 domain-containing protein [Phormidium yuhuli]USR90916.1 hypothetical protein NEA10_19165 [Phormidium yuhuli AB48]